MKAELEGGHRRCHVYAVYTQKRDVTTRLAHILECEGIRTAVLTSAVPPEKREAWIAQKLREGVEVTISHPKIIETGLDLLGHPSLIFFESGCSLYTLRQASRRSWRIGQRLPVRVFYLHYEETIQSSCLRLMAKKMLVSLAMEGKFDEGGLHSFEEDDDILTALARNLSPNTASANQPMFFGVGYRWNKAGLCRHRHRCPTNLTAIPSPRRRLRCSR